MVSKVSQYRLQCSSFGPLHGGACWPGDFPFIGAIEGPQTCITRQFARDCMKNKKGSFDYAWLEMTGLWRRSRDWCTRSILFIKPRNWVSQLSTWRYVRGGNLTGEQARRRNVLPWLRGDGMPGPMLRSMMTQREWKARQMRMIGWQCQWSGAWRGRSTRAEWVKTIV